LFGLLVRVQILVLWEHSGGVSKGMSPFSVEATATLHPSSVRKLLRPLRKHRGAVGDRGVSRGSLHLAGAKPRNHFEGRHKASRPFSGMMFHRQDFRHLSFHNAVEGVKDNVKHLLGACRASSVIGWRDLIVVDLLTCVKVRRFGGEALALFQVYIVRSLLSLSSLFLTTIIIQSCLSFFDSFVLSRLASLESSWVAGSKLRRRLRRRWYTPLALASMGPRSMGTRVVMTW
jgi:hypothetical protein